MNIFKRNSAAKVAAVQQKEQDEVTGLLKKIRTLEIKSRRLSDHIFTGEYHTAFKGRGMVFKEVREYQAGDDVRFIDWNTSARMGSTYSKMFEEERELTVYLMVDVSASNLFGTKCQRKSDLIAEICAVLAFAAINNNDNAGLIMFSDKVEKYIPARKGRDHVLYMIRELITHSAHSSQTEIIKALQFLNNVTRRKSIVFILSDFADTGYHDSLKVAAKRHDVIGVQIYDPGDATLPRAGLIEMQDAETGKMVLIDTNDPYIRNRYYLQFMKIMEDAKIDFRNGGADLIQIANGEDYVKKLREFFIRRV